MANNIPVSPELKEAIDRAKALNGGSITAEQFNRIHRAIHPEDFGEQAAPETPYPKIREFMGGVDTALSNAPFVKHFGEVKQGIEQGYADFEEAHPIAAIVPNTALNMLSVLPTALYGAENLLGSAVGIDDLDSIIKLSQIMPKTAKALKSDPSGRDLVSAGMLMKGGFEKPSFLNKGTSTPLNFAKSLGNATRIGYNATVDPIGSLFKYPEWDAARRAVKDAEGKASYEKQIKEKIDQLGEKERPAPLSEEEMAVAEHLRTNNMFPIQAEMRRRLENTQKSLKEQGVQSGGIASEIASNENYGFSDAEVMYLAQHPEFRGNEHIQRMYQNILDRPVPPVKPTLAKGGSRSPMKTMGIDYTTPSPTNIQVTNPPKPLRVIGEQPPLRGLEDVAGTSGPLATTEDGVLFHPDLKVEEGANAPVLGKSRYSAEGVNIPEYDVHAQENLDTNIYPSESPYTGDAYDLRQKMDESAKWVYNKEGFREAERDPILGGMANKIRGKYQSSPKPLPPQFSSAFSDSSGHIQKLVDSENAIIMEENKLAPPEARKPLIEFPKTIGEATSLLNRDTVRAFEQEQKLKSAIVGEREISLANQMGGSGDPRALAEELNIHRKYPELKEFSERVEKAKQYNKDVEAHQNKIEDLKNKTESLPYSRTRNFSDPEFLDDFAKQMLFWGPEKTIAKNFAIKAPELILGGIRKTGIKPNSKWITAPRAASGPWGLMQNSEDTYYKENEQ